MPNNDALTNEGPADADVDSCILIGWFDLKHSMEMKT